MDDEVGKHRSTKNRRAWCRGRTGVAHTPKCVDYQATKHWMAGKVALDGWKILICTTCGKELATYSPMRLNVLQADGSIRTKEPEAPPSWVTDLRT